MFLKIPTISLPIDPPFTYTVTKPLYYSIFCIINFSNNNHSFMLPKQRRYAYWKLLILSSRKTKVNVQSHHIRLMWLGNLATHREQRARRWYKYFSAGFLPSKISNTLTFSFILNYNSGQWKANCTGAHRIYFAFVNTLFETLQTLLGKVHFDCVYFCIQVIQVYFSRCSIFWDMPNFLT